MNAAYICVSCGFFTHRKTLRLLAAIGDRAFWIPPKLWAYAAVNQKNGNFSDYSPEDFEAILGLKSGDGAQVRAALQSVKFLTAKGWLNDWKHWNKFFGDGDRFKKAIKARYEQENAAQKANNLTRDQWLDLPRHERRLLVAEYRAKQNPTQEPQTPTPTGTSGGNSKKIWEAKERVKAIEQLLKGHKGNPEASNYDKLSAPEFRQLKRDRDTLLKQISMPENSPRKDA